MKPSISREEAFLAYVSLGPDRSLGKLHQLYTKNTLKSPSIDTLKAWSRKDGWQARLHAHNDNVMAIAEEQLVAMEADLILAAARQFLEAAMLTLQRCCQAAEHMEIRNWRDATYAQQIAVGFITAAVSIQAKVYLPDTAANEEDMAIEREFCAYREDARQKVMAFIQRQKDAVSRGEPFNEELTL